VEYDLEYFSLIIVAVWYCVRQQRSAMATPKQYFSALEPILDSLAAIPHKAWNDLVSWIPESEFGAMFPIPRAGLVQWRMVVHAQNAFGTNGPIRVVHDDDGLHFLYVDNENEPVACEFGKADDSLCRSKNQNNKNRLCLEQMSLWHYETEPKRFNLVYTVGGYGLSAHIDRVVLTMEGKDGIAWFKELYRSSGDQGDDFGIAVQPVDPDSGPLPPQIIPKPTVKEDEERKQPARENVAG
jgi:hypothetical protein